MSESSFPFEGQTMTAAPPAVPVEETDGNRGKLLVLGGLAAAVVVAVAYFLLFAGGGSDEEPVGPVRNGGAQAPAPAVEQPAAPAKKGKKLTAKSFGRDPYRPLVVPAAESDAPAPAPVTAPAGGGAAAGGGTTVESGVSAPVASTAHSFRVVEVAPDNSSVTVKVDGKVYRNLRAGEVFAKFFKVVLISGTTNAFQYGEEKFNVLGTKRLTIA